MECIVHCLGDDEIVPVDAELLEKLRARGAGCERIARPTLVAHEHDASAPVPDPLGQRTDAGQDPRQIALGLTGSQAFLHVDDGQHVHGHGRPFMLPRRRGCGPDGQRSSFAPPDRAPEDLPYRARSRASYRGSPAC